MMAAVLSDEHRAVLRGHLLGATHGPCGDTRCCAQVRSFAEARSAPHAQHPLIVNSMYSLH